MYQEDAFVVLEPDQSEQFLSREELLTKLIALLQSHQNDLPRDLQKFNTTEKQAQHLIDSYCEFELSPGYALQWYVVRLEK